MRAVHVGLGGFGFGWLTTLTEELSGVEVVAVVDADEASHARVAEIDGLTVPTFADLATALDRVDADFVLNCTPPRVHAPVNLVALTRGLPVLCEKPIADSWADAKTLFDASNELNTPLTIAENYRFSSGARLVKDLLGNGAIGRIHAVNIRFFRNHSVGERSYHRTLEHPLLLDVAVHHFDLLRFFTEEELIQVHCRAWTPSWSSYHGKANADIFMELTGGVRTTYVGSLSSKAKATNWMGDWQIEGERGTLYWTGNARATVLVDGAETGHAAADAIHGPAGRHVLLEEFIRSLREHREAETSIQDNIRSYAITIAAMRASGKYPTEHVWSFL